MLSHTIQQPNIPDVGESCTNTQHLPNLSQRGAVPSWTRRKLLENFGRVSSLHCCALLQSHSFLYLHNLLTKNAIMWLPKLKTLCHPLTCCRADTLLFHVTPAIHFSQVRASCSPFLAPWQHARVKCPLCQASVQGELCLVPYYVGNAGAHQTRSTPEMQWGEVGGRGQSKRKVQFARLHD